MLCRRKLFVLCRRSPLGVPAISACCSSVRFCSSSASPPPPPLPPSDKPPTSATTKSTDGTLPALETQQVKDSSNNNRHETAPSLNKAGARETTKDAAKADASTAAKANNSPATKSSGPPSPQQHPSKNVDDTFAKDGAVPRGFEAFYAKSIVSKMLPQRSPSESVQRAYAMSPQERILIAEIAGRARLQRTFRHLGILSTLLAVLIGYRWYTAQARLDADVSKYSAVIVDVPGHTAVYVDEKGKFIGVRNFIDYDAFEKMCDPDKDILVEFSTYYPWIPMLLLCLLPVLAVVNAGFNGSARMITMVAQAEKARFSFKREMSVTTRLKDVAGLTEAKHEVVEVIDFLKHPQRYQTLGAKLPKGVLLDGPPGVGKTLLAKAVAGEAMVPFVSCSGSEFEEVYVGVGAQRVRELFREAHNCKPCVVFIDEIDAFGRKRKSEGNGSSRGTLNAFLAALDGFKDASGIMVLAATNRADILDNALTRSGRFDRKISLEKPSYKDRIAIALVHLQPLHLDPCVSVQGYAETVAALTPGCSGADIFNVCNEAAIQAARDDKDYVGSAHFHQAVERVLVGLEKSAVKYTPHEKERLAYHEAGIVVLNWFQSETDPVIKSTILPRGRHRTGVTQKLPQNIYISTQERLLQRIVGRLGGYVSEEYFFSDVSTSAAEDLQMATSLARDMVCVYGMDPAHIGHMGFELDRDDTLQKPFGPEKEDAVDIAVESIVQSCLERARVLLKEHHKHTRMIAGLLLKQETLNAHEMWFALGDRPVMSKEFQTYLES
ncbi:putative mitochondrial Mitochondrial ATP-dependent zinc metallopeptidase [Leptomonas pyrrhocoris]|uniref:Putative mitochondrial Mitochondrial ATP-dependent zinc metallopeptidase n=1 Tax=Leptomonas pyrrhocoris TaxID=157538 RepID=A0A0N0DWY0_LEPPY|nr:putative mitochondrial Mitochondrial ATP-dependent zinc metallopeptidase [Leptomonas pyrrhocoris]KPA82162.1 putative mitochondrial Mitochondrial ATP-dependent zinc metallopeptidase [Leptomonas pyrrhocoris]|eukprot:XP_015660601.1 putative mitochondrial Mitochondrial ATP-dependent zinc metallopeptidase [Leptomonas pyrrhocoris]